MLEVLLVLEELVVIDCVNGGAIVVSVVELHVLFVGESEMKGCCE